MSNDDDDLITKIFKRIVLTTIIIGAIAGVILVLIVLWWGIERVFNLQTPKEFRSMNVYDTSLAYWEAPRLHFQTLGSLMGNPLIDCFVREESSGNPYAFNPRDIDGRPKYGLLQFDAGTFDSYCVKTYKLDDDIWNPETQRNCCQEMIDDGLAWHWGTYKKCKQYDKL